MTGGESNVGNADLDSLVLDFMRVIAAQHGMFYSEPPNAYNSSLHLHLKRFTELYEGLGLRAQPTSVLWMLIIKLARMRCVTEINAHYNGGKGIDAERFLNYHFDYQLMDDEVELVLAPDNFTDTLNKLEAKKASSNHGKPAKFTCRLFLRDNRVMLALNDMPYQVARVNGGSTIERLLLRLERLPSSEQLSAIEFSPNRKDLNFGRILDKYGYGWLKPMLPVCEPTVISIQNPISLDVPTLLGMLPEIAENYRQPIAAYLGIEQAAAK